MKIIQAKWWVLVILMSAFNTYAWNDCLENPHTQTNSFTCLQQGTLATNYTLTPTNINVGVGQIIPQPTVSGLSMTNGLQKYYVTNECYPEQSGWDTNAVSYTFGSLYFAPAFTNVFWTAGTYVFTGMVVATGSPCGPITNTLRIVTTIVTNGPPVITVQPAGQVVAVGGVASFSVTARGTVPLSYQWYFNGTNLLAGATNASLTITDVQSTNAGNYSVVVNNAFGSVTSSNATLMVVVPMIITVPTNQPVVSGGTVAFAVTVDAGGACDGPFTYQWLHDGTNISVNDAIITTVAGNGSSDSSGDGGLATNAGFESDGVAADTFGNFYIIDTYDAYAAVIRKVDTNGIITRVAGRYGEWGYSGDGGLATHASLADPSGVVVDASGNLYIADAGNGVIRKVNTNGIITTVAGGGTGGGSDGLGDGGSATNAGLSYPSSVAVDVSGNLYIADTGNFVIRKVDTNGIITTVAGNGSYGYSGDGGPATNASLSYPYGVVVDTSDNLYIIDRFNFVIRKVDTNGIITTVAGNGSYGYSGDGGLATNANFSFLNGMAVDTSGNLYIADTGNFVIRKVDTNGIITTVAGNGSYGYSGDGGLATNASLYSPSGVAVGVSGHNFYIADIDVIRKVDTKIIFNAPTFTLFDVTTNDTGNYQVIVTSPCGSVTSSVVTVLILPTITTQPVNQTVIQGRNATFSVTATSMTPLYYQWRLNGTSILGATNASLTLANVQPSQAGNYSVVLSNAAGSVTSANASLTVDIPQPFPGLNFKVVITRPTSNSPLP